MGNACHCVIVQLSRSVGVWWRRKTGWHVRASTATATAARQPASTRCANAASADGTSQSYLNQSMYTFCCERLYRYLYCLLSEQ